MSKKEEEKKEPTPEEVVEETAAPAEDTQPQEITEEVFTVTREQMEKMEAVAQELSEQKEKFLRLAAEYDNYRKRTAKEREQLYNLAKASTIEALLPVYDNIALSVAQESTDAQYKKGVEMIARQLDEVFAKLGVSEIAAQRGDAFDPELHNAVMHIEDPELQENRIAAVFQKGFKAGDKVIRHAVVQVAN